MAKAKTETRLIWNGGDPFPGWPACDHEESNPDLYQAKRASGLYRAPDDKEDATLEAERRAAKALANAQAAKAAREAAGRAQEAAERAQRDAAERRERLRQRMAAARASLASAEESEGELETEPIRPKRN